MNDRTLSVRLNNRLGNQMFEYAFARALAERMGVSQCVLVGKDPNRLDCFDLSDKVSFAGTSAPLSWQTRCVSKLMGKMASLLEHYPKTLYFLERYLQWMLNRCGLFFCLDGFIEVKPQRFASRPIYCSGYFQSERYFSGYRDLLCKEFTFKDSITNSVQTLAQQIASCNAVCVHVRMGDYKTLPNRQVCDKSYYTQAIAYIREHVADAHFFVFSDEPDCASQLLSLTDCTIIPSEYTDQQSMYLGSLCCHHIISNSSFAWWMQYLAFHPNQIVVAPQRWMNDDTPVDIYQAHWVII